MFGNVIDKKSPNSTTVIPETIRYNTLEFCLCSTNKPGGLFSGAFILVTTGWVHFNSSQGLRTAQASQYQQSSNSHISLPHNPTTSLLHQHLATTSLNRSGTPSQQKTFPFYCWLVLCWLSKLNWSSHMSSKSLCQHRREAGTQD